MNGPADPVQGPAPPPTVPLGATSCGGGVRRFLTQVPAYLPTLPSAMVTYTLVSCPQCNAPLPNLAPTGVMHCDYCGVALVPSVGGVRLMQPQETELPEPGRTRLWAGGRRYILDGRVAKGSSSDVFLGRFDHRLSEQVVVKMLRAPDDADVFVHEWEVLGPCSAPPVMALRIFPA